MWGKESIVSKYRICNLYESRSPSIKSPPERRVKSHKIYFVSFIISHSHLFCYLQKYALTIQKNRITAVSYLKICSHVCIIPKCFISIVFILYYKDSVIDERSFSGKCQDKTTLNNISSSVCEMNILYTNCNILIFILTVPFLMIYRHWGI